MNKKQLIVMWIGLGIIILSTLFPLATFPKGIFDSDWQITTRPVFLYSSTYKQDNIQHIKMVPLQFITALITSGLIVTLNKKKVS